MTDWKELARKHEDSANHYARRCYDLEALNAELVEAGQESADMLRKHLGFGPSTKLELLLAKARGES